MTNQTTSVVLNKIAFYQGRRDEIPNQELAKELAATHNAAGIKEIADHLWDKNKNVQSDCLKVLYEIGYLNPDLIADCAADFLKLLKSKNNRLVWGAMIGLATIADRRAADIWRQVDDVMQTVTSGSVITTVWGIKALAKVAATGPERRKKIFPFLLRQVESCLPRDIPTHAANMLCTVDESVKTEFLSTLAARQPELTPAQRSRLKKVLNAADSFGKPTEAFLKMNISIREFTPQEYADIVNVRNANYAMRPLTKEAWIEAEKTRNPKCKARRWVACEAGRIVGFGDYDQDISDYHPQRFYVDFVVLPEYQQRGIGAALYEQVLAALQAFDPRVLRANAYSTHPQGLRFLEKQGFHEAWRETPVQLDVSAFDPSPYAGLEENLRAQGFEIKTLRDLESDPNRNRKVYDLYWQIFDTLPREESEVTNMDFDDWARWTLNENQVPGDGYFIVTYNAEYIGLKELSVNMSDKTVLQGGLLGVIPEYRRRGIALAMQLRANAYAREHGYQLIKSSTGAFHTPMQSLFTKLGYIHLYDWYQMEKRL